jgi:hypothetical protein
MKVEGSCHCGQISFEAEVDPLTVSICHCTDCQTLTGSAYRVTVPSPVAVSFCAADLPASTSRPLKAATRALRLSAPTAARRSTQPIRANRGYMAFVSGP